MKNIFLATFIALLFSCNTKTESTTKTDTSSNAAYAPSEGDVMRKDGKVMVWHDGEWEVANNDVHLSDGVVVNTKGEVSRGDRVVVLDDGEVVDRSGRFFDKAGNAVEDAWDATKKGVKKVGEEIKDVFDGNDKDTKKDKNKDKDK